MKTSMLLSMLPLVLIGCASGSYDADDVRISLPSGQQPATPPPPKTDKGVDYYALAQSLGMVRPADDLGYKQKSFNTCDAGNGYSDSEDCRREYMVAIHFQLMCRDVEGSADRPVTQADIHPISHRTIAWTLDKKKGTIVTDARGYGQIHMAFPKRPNQGRLKLSTNQKFLFLQADEITRIVSPPLWCR